MCPCGSSLWWVIVNVTGTSGWVCGLTVTWVVLCNISLSLWCAGVELRDGGRRQRWRPSGSMPMDREQWRTHTGLRLRDQEVGWLAEVADTWGHWQAQVYMVVRVDQVKTVVKRIERRLWGLVDRAVEDNGDTCRGAEDTYKVRYPQEV
jgi:hypothetical protein